jgi:hypothetical protein
VLPHEREHLFERPAVLRQRLDEERCVPADLAEDRPREKLFSMLRDRIGREVADASDLVRREIEGSCLVRFCHGPVLLYREPGSFFAAAPKRYQRSLHSGRMLARAERRSVSWDREDTPQAGGDAGVGGKVLGSIFLGRPAGSEGHDLLPQRFRCSNGFGGTAGLLEAGPMLDL